jgi:hypothetical protein
MNVYRRYFRVTEGPIVEDAKEVLSVNKKAQEEYSAILEEIGACSTQWWQRGNRLVGIKFDHSPGNNYKKINPGWYPKKNTKAGRELCKRLESIETREERFCLRSTKLGTLIPVLFGGGKAYGVAHVIIPSDPPVVYVSVPWYDEDPGVLSAYKNDKNHISANLDHLLWEPTEHMRECKEWEYKRAIEEWNESIKCSS